MSTTETHAPTSPAPQAKPALDAACDLRWTVWPLRDRLAVLWWTPLATLAVGGLVAARVGSPAMGVAAAVALGVTLLPQWSPVTYQFADDGLIVSRFGQRRLVPWTRVQAVRSRAGGATLFSHTLTAGGQKEWSSIRITFPAADNATGGELRRRVEAARKITAA